MNPSLDNILNQGCQAASKLVFFRYLHDKPVFKSWFNLVKAALEGQELQEYYYHFLAVIYPWALTTSGDAWENYIDHEILMLDNDFTRQLQQDTPIMPSLLKAVNRESELLTCVRQVNAILLSQVCQNRLEDENPVTAAEWNHETAQPHIAEDGQVDLVNIYRRYGSGPAAIYPVLRWNAEVGLIGVRHPEVVSLDSLIGYNRQKEALIANTQRLLSGLPCQHALLYGPRGSGKSSLIKAVTGLFYKDNLRLLELSSQDMEALSEIIDYVRGRRHYFVLYIDDLSFEAYETGYKSLKNLLEGSVEHRPANLVVYATSNRRHIVQERYADRLDGDDLHPGETRQEKLALADRFGLSIYFPSPNQELYLEMVRSMAAERGLNIPEAELIPRALTWEKEKSGPSGRAARQFVDSL